MNRIYMDNAATTRVSEPVAQAMMPYLTEVFGNPSSVHSFGREAHKALDHARAQVARALGAEPKEIYFTGCGTESDNWAIRGAAYAHKDKGNHIITTTIEHHAVLHTCEQLEKEGFEVTYLDVDEYGLVDVKALEAAIRPTTVLITVMAANNEIGTMEPIEEIGRVAREHKVLFHTDAVQAIGSVPFDVKRMNIDMLSLSGHKFHAPKGVGALYIRSGVKIDRFIRGGAQERGQRAGTENLASIVGMGRAIELAAQNLEAHNAKLSALRDRLYAGLAAHDAVEATVDVAPGSVEFLPNIVHVLVRGLESETLILRFDLRGFGVSGGSACSSHSLAPSHVLHALGIDDDRAHGALRISMGRGTAEEDVDAFLGAVAGVLDWS